jgi:toxin ParE1/3/4
VTIQFHSEARKELFAIAEYYEEQVVGLGDAFLDKVEEVIDVIQQFPRSGKKITSTERRYLVSRFPHGVIYSVEGEFINIYAIMDLRRKPDYWQSRT